MNRPYLVSVVTCSTASSDFLVGLLKVNFGCVNDFRGGPLRPLDPDIVILIIINFNNKNKYVITFHRFKIEKPQKQ